MAALSVAVFHTVVLRELIPFDSIPDWFKALYIAVPLFFAISAFSLSTRYNGSLNRASDCWHFYLRRFFRIAPLFYLMVAAWILTYSYLWQQWKTPPIEDIVLNLTFVFNFLPEKVGSIVPAGWSLGTEMVFYAFFPVLLFVIRNVWTGVVALIFFSAVAVFAGIIFTPLPNTFAWFSAVCQAPFFVAGIVLFHMFRQMEGWSQQARKCTALGLLISSPALLVLLSELGGHSIVFDGWHPWPHLTGAALLPLVLAFALHPFRLVVNRVTVFFGEISYGIYLIHPVAIVLVGRPIQTSMEGQPQWLILLSVVAGVLTTAIILASATYYGFERRISRWRPRARRATIETASEPAAA